MHPHRSHRPARPHAAPPSSVERRSIDVMPASERHGTPMNQFTLWMAANLHITAIVDGALAVVFGADACGRSSGWPSATSPAVS